MFNKIVLVLLIVMFVPSVVFASDISAEAIIAQLKATQSKVRDLQADIKTTMVSNISMPGQPSKGPQTSVQKGHIWTKGKDKSKIEITSPMRQTTITNGSIMTMISPDTGQKFTQDLSKMQGAGVKGQGPSTGSGRGMDSTKALDYFDLTVTEHGTTEYIITGKPKEANQFLGKMDFMIDAERYLPLRIAMYNPKGMLISLSEIEYQSFGSTGEAVVWVPVKIKSVVTMQMGSVNSEMVYENIKVNQGIKDSVFEE